MSRAYDAAAWPSFFQAVVAAAAALLGPLFVAASLRIAVVTDSAPHQARAREAPASCWFSSSSGCSS